MAITDLQKSRIDAIVDKMTGQGMFETMTRYRTAYDMDVAMALVEAIGRQRNPRFVIDDENRFTYDNFIRWCHGDETMQCLDPETLEPVQGRLKKGIYIAGNTGTGKSWCLEIMQMYCKTANLRICFRSKGITPLSWAGVRVEEICGHYAASGKAGTYAGRDILAIQDLGSEMQETVYMGNRADVIRQLIEQRGDRQDVLTLITSNLRLGGDKLLGRYGDRVASRLHEMCNYFEIKGKDRRKIKTK